MPETNQNRDVATEARRLVLMKFAQMKLEEANALDTHLDQMRLKLARQMEKLKAAANAKDLARLEATIHRNEDIDAYIRLDKGGSADINADHIENLGHTSINIMIEKIGRFVVQKPRMIQTQINDGQKAKNDFEYYSVMDFRD